MGLVCSDLKAFLEEAVLAEWVAGTAPVQDLSPSSVCVPALQVITTSGLPIDS